MYAKKAYFFGKNSEVGFYKKIERGGFTMKTLGRHIMAELSNCDPEILGNLEQIRRIMIQAAKEANAQVREVIFHKFSPQGISGVVVIAESHLSIHTWPEYGYAAIDIYTCGETTYPWKACQFAVDEFRAGNIATIEVERGKKTADGWYGHTISTSCWKEGSLVAQQTV